MIQDDPSVIDPIIAELKATFLTNKTRSISFRKAQLKAMLKGVVELEQQFHEALEKDLGVKQFGSILTSTMITKIDIEHNIANLKSWTKPQQIDTPIVIGPGSSKIVYEPLGVVLVLAAWNYPVYVALPPMAAAIAAGNCVVLKPSEMAPYTSKVLLKLVSEYLDPTCFRVIEGGSEVAKTITSKNFDLIIFTGSSEKGKLVAKAASDNLVPCILELGGKSPTIIDKDANLNVTAQRIIQGRFMNAGQTCVACDFLLVDQTIVASLTQQLQHWIKQFYGENPKNSEDYSRIVNEFHTKRIEEIIQTSNGQLVCGGEVDLSQKYISPTIILNPSINSKAMTEEIFGPVLPIITYKDFNEVIKFINDRPKPLALYYFGSNKKNFKRLETETSSGALVKNDALFHLLNPDLPFGGVGNSGYGAYHGITGFKACSHAKSVFDKCTLNVFPFNQRYPPYPKCKQQLLQFLLVIFCLLFIGLNFHGSQKEQSTKGFLQSLQQLL